MCDPLRRIDFTLTLRVMSALHIGSGESSLMPETPDGATPEAALIQRNGDMEPYLPATSLKGALRALAEDDAPALFGTIGTKDTGAMGKILLRGSSQFIPALASGLPYEDKGVFTSAQTEIDDGRGIAARTKLFYAEAIAPGAIFETVIRLEARQTLEQLEQSLVDMLMKLAAEHGQSVGANAASGLGRIKLERLERTDWRTDPPTGAFVSGVNTTIPLVPAQEQNTAIVLNCEHPYFTRDYSWTRPTNSTSEPHLKALRSGDKPYITGDGVSGALRARLEWLSEIDALREEVSEAKPYAERLFGKVGWKGLVTVMVVDATRAGKSNTTSVKIDRFSGGSIDNALFVIDADHGVELSLRLELDERRANNEDTKLFERLLASIRTKGLELGAGTGRGFGWFSVKELAA